MFANRMLVLTTVALVVAFLRGGATGTSLQAATYADVGAAPPSWFRPYEGATNVDPDGLALSWSAVANARSYGIYFGASPDGLSLLSSVTEPRLAIAAPLTRGECYYWRVDTSTLGGATIPGPPLRFTIIPPLHHDPALVAWYGFDEAAGGVSYDLSGIGSDATLRQMVWETVGAPGLDGGSIRSDGLGSVRFEIPAKALPLDQLTLTGWFRIQRQDEPATLWSLGSGATSYVSLVPQPAGGGGLVIRVRTASPSQPVETQVRDPLPLDHWTHLAVTMDAAAEQVTVYEDGAVVLMARDLTRLAGVLESATSVLLGTSFASNVCLRCSMDDVRLYMSVLDAGEISRTMLCHPDSPYEPQPRHEAQVHTSTPGVVRWQATDAALAYDVYAGTNRDRLALVQAGWLETECLLNQKLTNGQTLYWQVEAVVAGGIVRGPLWRFSATGLSLADIVEHAQPWWPDYTDYYGRVARDLSLTDMDGRGHRLRDYRGRHLLVVIWAPWCSVCREEMVTLSQLRQEISEDEMVLLAITDESGSSTVPSFLAAHPEINFPVCITKVYALPSPFGDAFHFPSIFYIAPDGTIELATIGEVPVETMKPILNATWPYQP